MNCFGKDIKRFMVYGLLFFQQPQTINLKPQTINVYAEAEVVPEAALAS